MAQSESEIINEIVAHIQQEGGPFNAWYTGITSNIQDRLFGDHGVPQKDHWFIWRKALSIGIARQIEETLIYQYGTDGGPGGGDYSSVYVYSYKKTAITDP